MKQIQYISVLVLVVLALSFSANYTGFATNTNNASGTVSFNFVFSIVEQTLFNLGSTSAQVNFTSNFKSNGTVFYGIVNLTSNSSDNLSSLDHTLNLTSLTPSTTYTYSLLAQSFLGNATLGPFNFTTFPGLLDAQVPIFNYILPNVANASQFVNSTYNFTLNITDNDLVENVTLNYGTGQIILNGSNDIYTFTIPNFVAGTYILNFTATDRSGNINTLNYTYVINKATPFINVSENSIAYFENETKLLEIITETNNYSIQVINNTNPILNLGNFTTDTNLSLNSSALAFNGNLSLPVGNFLINITTYENSNYLTATKLISVNVYDVTQTLISFLNVNNPYEFTKDLVNVTLSTQGPEASSVGINDTRFVFNNTVLNSTILDVGTYNLLVEVNNTLNQTSQAILIIEVTDTTAPNISNITLNPNTSYYIENNRVLDVLISDSSLFNASININSQSISYINDSFNLGNLGAGTYYYTITATDIYGNTVALNQNLTIEKNNVYDFDFELNGVAATAYSIRPSTNYNVYTTIPGFNKTFDVILKNVDTGNTTVIVTDVLEYNTSNFLISSNGNYEIQLVSQSNDNFTALTKIISLTVSTPSTPSTGGSGGSGGGGGGGSGLGGRDSDDDDEQECVSSFSCTAWSECSTCPDCDENEGKQTRSCETINICEDDSLPSLKRSCNLIIPRDPVIGDSGICKEIYECTDWSSCVDSKRSRECTQVTDCEPDYIPELERSCEEYISFDDILNRRIVDLGNVGEDDTKSEIVLDADIVLFNFNGVSYQIQIEDADDKALVGIFANTGSELIFKNQREYFLDLDGDGAVDVQASYHHGEKGRFYVRGIGTKIQTQIAKVFEPEFEPIQVVRRSVNLIVAALVILLLLITFALTKDYVYEYVSETKRLIKNDGKSKKQLKSRKRKN